MNRALFLLLALGSVTGCRTNGGPLVFVVTHTVGLDVQATSASSATPGVTFGYKSVDLAIVPVQKDTAGGDPLKGCYTTGQNSDPPFNCASDGTPAPRQPAGGAHPSSGTQRSGGIHSLARVRDEGADHPQLRGDAPTPVMFAAPPPPSPQANQPGGDTTKFSEGVVDAYSVFASFNTNASAGSGNKGSSDNSGTGNATGTAGTDSTGTTQDKSTPAKTGGSSGGLSVGVGLGELFATGDAAVQLAEGVNYYMSRAGSAEIAKAQAGQPCVSQGPSGKATNGSDSSKQQGCPNSGPSTPAEAKTTPTLTDISPKTGTGPASGATAATKVVVLLTGTGFGSTSELAIAGTGVTYEQLTASTDGKTMTATLDIAPNAPKAACTISVTQPGGAASSGVTFTVQ